MARNKSEKIPHSDLHAEIHRYYAARYGVSGESTDTIYECMPVELRGQLNRIWYGPKHRALVAYYKEQQRAQRT